MIARFKHIEVGTNSKREQYNMMREIPLAFEDNSHPILVDKWLDKLARVKSFIDTKERTPKAKSSDTDERKNGLQDSNKLKEKPTANVNS